MVESERYKSVYIDGNKYIDYDRVNDLAKANAVKLNEDLVYIFKDQFLKEKELYEDYKKEGLTFGLIEAEGAYRALLILGRNLELIDDNGEFVFDTKKDD